MYDRPRQTLVEGTQGEAADATWKSHLDIGKILFHHESGQSLEWVSQSDCKISCLGNIPAGLDKVLHNGSKLALC